MPITVLLPSRRILSTRNDGNRTRKKLNLDELDFNNDPQIHVLISINTWALNASFFIGCFLESMKNLGKEKFEEKYKFISEERYIYRMIKDGISRCEKIIECEANRNGPTKSNTRNKLSRYFHL
jgi:hypothetical protein